MAGSVVEWNSRHPQMRRFNHGYTSKLFCVRHYRTDSKIRCRVAQTGQLLNALVLSGLANSCVGNFSLIRFRKGQTLWSTELHFDDARDIAVTKIVPESNVLISLRIASSEKQIPRFIGNVSGRSPQFVRRDAWCDKIQNSLGHCRTSLSRTLAAEQTVLRAETSCCHYYQYCEEAL
jgi:hypothetical protein